MSQDTRKTKHFGLLLLLSEGENKVRDLKILAEASSEKQHGQRDSCIWLSSVVLWLLYADKFSKLHMEMNPLQITLGMAVLDPFVECVLLTSTVVEFTLVQQKSAGGNRLKLINDILVSLLCGARRVARRICSTLDGTDNLHFQKGKEEFESMEGQIWKKGRKTSHN